VTRQAVAKQQEGYQKAETAYTKTIEAADKAFAAAQAKAAQSGDPSILTTAQAVKDRDYAQAVIDREKAKGRVAAEYDAAVKSIGGTPGSQATADNPPQGATARVKDANGKLIGYAVNGQFVPLGQ
jgi:arabinogalactan endo-1,4-beta-galactosidase